MKSTADCGLRIADCNGRHRDARELSKTFRNPQSEIRNRSIRNPQSTIRNRSRT